VVVGLAFGARVFKEGVETVRECGFAGDGDKAYAGWLGRRHRREVWGQVFSNAMVLAIRLSLRYADRV
jgi:hypothetical protein